MTDIIVLLVVAVIIALIVFYIFRTKKKGNKCIGCPYSDTCSGNNSSGCCNGAQTLNK